jgi:hypothetical protein
MLAINNCVSQSTQKTPYEMVFGQPARNDHDFWLELHKQPNNNSILNEEDLPDSISKVFNSTDDTVRIKKILFFLLFFFKDNK